VTISRCRPLCELADIPQIAVDKLTDPPERSEVMRLVCDNSKAARVGGVATDARLRDGLAQTLQFVEAHPHLFRPTATRSDPMQEIDAVILAGARAQLRPYTVSIPTLVPLGDELSSDLAAAARIDPTSQGDIALSI